MTKRLLSIFLAGAIALPFALSMPCTAYAEEEYARYDADTDSDWSAYHEDDEAEISLMALTRGTCGEDIEWEITDNTLTISGMGDMYDYAQGGAPWSAAADVTKIIIENGVTGIGDYAFYGCGAAESVTIPDTVSYIGRSAFANTALNDVTFPLSLEYIGDRAFENTKISVVRIPQNVRFIGAGAFWLNNNLSVFEVDESNINYSSKDGVLFNYDKTALLQYTPLSGGTEYEIPDSVEEIGYGAFSGAADLKNITFNEGLKKIGDYAFSECGALTGLTLPEGLEYIGSYAFRSAGYHITRDENENIKEIIYGIKSVTVPKNVAYIGDLAFSAIEEITVDSSNPHYKSEDGVLFTSDGTELLIYPSRRLADDYTVPNTVTAIHSYAFYTSRILNITIPDSVTDIGSYTFTSSGVAHIMLSENIKAIGARAFYACTYLKSIDIPEGVTSIGNYAFYRCMRLESVTIPVSVTSIGSYAFTSCSALTDVYYNSTKTYWNNNISKSNGGDPSGMSNVTLHCAQITSGQCGKNLTWEIDGEGTLTISGSGNMEYEGDPPWKVVADEVKKVVIGEGVTSVQNRAFSACSALTSIEISSTVKRIGELFTLNCYNLNSITVAEGSESFKVDNTGALYSYDGKTLLRCLPAGNARIYSLADGTEQIWGGAFAHCDVMFVYGMENVSYIGADAFYYCEKLSMIELPEIKEIRDYAFAYCTSMESIELPETLEKIGRYAFVRCRSLSEIILPDSVTFIDAYAFRYCTSMNNIFIPDTVSHMGAYALEYCSSLTAVRLPAALKEISAGLFYDDKNLTAAAIPEGVTSIGRAAFYGCESLYFADIPRSAGEIGDYAFYGCESLRHAEIPDGMASLSRSTFYNCNSLSSLILPSELVSVGDYAFRNCRRLEKIIFTGTEDAYGQIKVSDVQNECLSLAEVSYNKNDRDFWYGIGDYKNVFSAEINENEEDTRLLVYDINGWLPDIYVYAAGYDGAGDIISLADYSVRRNQSASSAVIRMVLPDAPVRRIFLWDENQSPFTESIER